MDISPPIDIGGGVFWVGQRFDDGRIPCNTYLLVEGADAIVFDPGPISAFPTMLRKVLDLVDLDAITTVILSHHGPDVCGALAVLEKVAGTLVIIAHPATARLLSHLPLRSRVRPVRDTDGLTLQTGRALRFVPIPFVNTAGALATYDVASRSLFTGALFGTLHERWHVLDGSALPVSLDGWHQSQLPSGEVLRAALRRVEPLDVDTILPYRGPIVRGPSVEDAFDHLRALRCGIDLELP